MKKYSAQTTAASQNSKLSSLSLKQSWIYFLGVCMNNDDRKLKCKAVGYQEKRGKIYLPAVQITWTISFCHLINAHVFISRKIVVSVKMMVKAYRVGTEARERVKDLILDDHTQCGCECGEELGGSELKIQIF